MFSIICQLPGRVSVLPQSRLHSKEFLQSFPALAVSMSRTYDSLLLLPVFDRHRSLEKVKRLGPDHLQLMPKPGLSQMQLQKSLEQYQKIPKSVVVQHKIGVRMKNVKNRTKYHWQNKLK